VRLPEFVSTYNMLAEQRLVCQLLRGVTVKRPRSLPSETLSKEDMSRILLLFPFFSNDDVCTIAGVCQCQRYGRGMLLGLLLCVDQHKTE